MTERNQFVRLFDKPEVHRSRDFMAFYKPNGKISSAIGITIKGKLGGGVWRTRLKRTIREWFRGIQTEFKEPVDLNILIRVPTVLDWDYIENLKKQLSDWKR